MSRFLNKKAVSYFNLGLCIISWAFIPIVSKKTLIELDNYQILFYSTIFSFLIMGIILILKKKLPLLKAYSFKDYSKMCALGFLGSYLYLVILYAALNLTSASEGFILAYTWPMLILVLAFIILREKVTFRKILSILISFFGIVVIVTKGDLTSLNFTSITGDLLAIIGAFVFALFSVLQKKINYDQIITVFVYFISALIFLVPTIILFSSFKMPSLNVWAWLLFNGLIVNGISYIFWFKALENGDTHIISNSLYLTPFLSLIYIYLILGEKILLSSILGLLIIVTGIVSQSLKFNKS